MDPIPIKIAALQRGLSLKQVALRAGINVRRWYRLIEDLAVATDEELARVATATGLPLETIRGALPRRSINPRPNDETPTPDHPHE